MMKNDFYWDDFTVGELHTTGCMTIDQQSITRFATEYDPQPFHLDAGHPSCVELGGLFASGYQSLGVTLRLTIDSGLFRHNIIGLGLDEVRWCAPVLVGMEVMVNNTVAALRPSASKPGCGVLVLDQMLLNTADQVTLMTCRLTIMLACRPA